MSTLAQYTSLVVVQGKIKRTKTFYVDEFETLKALVPADEVKNIKLTMCAPEWFHLRHGPYAYPKAIYATDGTRAFPIPNRTRRC